MWLSERAARPRSRRSVSVCIAVAVLISSSLLVGCGFRPLYGKNSAANSPGAMAQFASIEIPPLPDRTGQVMRNLLIDSLHPSGAAGDYLYRLNVIIREADVNLGLQQNSTSTRGQVRLTVDYYLIDKASGKTLLKETLRTSTGYNILINQFSSVISAEDARDQGLQQMADSITQHLALYFTSR
jgi:LPS-assembly lipoprotein